jgi:hypothetical protein
VSNTIHTIDYSNLVHKAMRGLILEVLTDVCQRPAGNHHFFITFDANNASGRRRLAVRPLPGEMTIVINAPIRKPEVTDQGFQSR